jgi:peptidoglycan/xylan/chitin deacetylase (PgdA/CDA1 family)
MVPALLCQLALQPAANRGAVVLCFHEISVDRFAGFVRQVRQHLDLISLDELVRRRLAGESMKGLLALTFDDGWRHTCEPVAELCEAERWPITIYLVSSLCRERGTLWFAELPRVTGGARGQRIVHQDYVLDLTTSRQERRTTDALIERLKFLPADVARDVVRELGRAAGLRMVDDGHEPFVSGDFVSQYARSEWVRFGSHTVHHQALAALDDTQLHAELSQSRAELEAMTGGTVQHFAYPYGAPDTIGTVAPQIVSQHYLSAVTLQRGICTSESPLGCLPRIGVYESDTNWRVVAKTALAPWM